MNTVELLAPAGEFDTALAAFAAGADAVYCGLADFSARAFAKNFSSDELKKLVRYARANGRKVYVTFNTLLDEDQLDGAVETLATLAEIGPDALIVQDLGVARLCRRHFPELVLHASTQLVAHNLEGVLALKELGFTRAVLARELSLEEIRSIAPRCGGMELEVFIHGALCYSVSGLCLYSAMEKGRSGNRGQCAYCCRLPQADERGNKTLPFSMKDLRLGEDVRKLVDAGVVSLKIEGRMKSALYVASVTRYYRQILDSTPEARLTPHEARRTPHEDTPLTVADLETVFSRRTTELYLNGRTGSPIDPDSLGHLGTPIGVVKKVTRDREGLAWLRFHTLRALEKHDGLQFDALNKEGRRLGMGIVEMRQTISRRPVFEVESGTDVELLVNDELEQALKPGMKIFCSMSNAVKRRFPTPSFRDSDWPGTIDLDVTVTVARDRACACATVGRAGEDACTTVTIAGDFPPAQHPEKSQSAAEKAFAKLGGTDYRLGRLTLVDPERRFLPASVLNDLRRDLVEKLDDARAAAWQTRLAAARDDEDWVDSAPLSGAAGAVPPPGPVVASRRVRLRAGAAVPVGDWNEVVFVISAETSVSDLNLQPQPQSQPQSQPSTSSSQPLASTTIRLALPVYTPEPDFNRLRSAVKRFLRAGFDRWEASDLATLRMLKALGVVDITADWTLYAFNRHALAALMELGVRRFVASPENDRENLQYLAESGYDIEFLEQQSTPLFISLTAPASVGTADLVAPADPVGTADLGRAIGDLIIYSRDKLWVTTKAVPRTFDVPEGASTRVDLSWDPA